MFIIRIMRSESKITVPLNESFNAEAQRRRDFVINSSKNFIAENADKLQLGS